MITGRPPALDNPVRDIIARGLAAGMTIRAAAQLAHVSEDSVTKWITRGRAEAQRREDPYCPENTHEERYYDFLGAIQKARADCVAQALETIQEFARGHDTVEETIVTVGSKPLAGGPEDVVEYVKERKVTVKTVRSWQAAAWILERTDPDTYGRVSRQVLSGDPNAPIQTETQVTLATDTPTLVAVANALADAGVLPRELGTPDLHEDVDPEVVEVHSADPDSETASVPLPGE